ncbi:conserved hypothetical protein [Bosea sp. 62]|uniref:DUF2934 domain-containing protein n=1 Tax=unclassified Bosea (in: a-proteobacteria) TaxID=2653178 RepID=UPI0012560783|nr:MULTISPECIES: DUF2934 domain-containing protein [unclassified Bosea (in: a-proteobacteria)]MDP3254718.1 DUF2934 domain-containing protein [Bosea sp. (in: a-proteobacteria)]CAD5291522.1 conserved hypothetical protein [Bosea sp. 21B]CAD5292640.1 conserved hypothetical protein [Bosea sp. 46]CAD5300076.1 conserved hypothetical protein [Bosea sp. 7B]VVT57175.1 conserved hypothetical protein [Bosea sp. EC-HK365B]
MSETDAAAEQDILRPKIELRAYEIWVHEGCPEGHDLEHWLRAESEIVGEGPSPEATDEAAVASKKKK